MQKWKLRRKKPTILTFLIIKWYHFVFYLHTTYISGTFSPFHMALAMCRWKVTTIYLLLVRPLRPFHSKRRKKNSVSRKASRQAIDWAANKLISVCMWCAALHGTFVLKKIISVYTRRNRSSFTWFISCNLKSKIDLEQILCNEWFLFEPLWCVCVWEKIAI